MSSRLASSIAQILGQDGDGRRKAFIQYISMQPLAVRNAMLIPNDATDPVNASRQAALQLLSEGWPDKGYQIDPRIMINDEDPLTSMQQRQLDGIPWVPALRMSQVQPSTPEGIAQPDPLNIPKGAIITTVDFSIPNEDIYVKRATAPFTYHFKWGGDGTQGPQGLVGTSYWPDAEDVSGELSIWKGDDKLFQKLWVIYDGKPDLLWVRIK